MISQVRAALARQLPGYRVRSVTPLGSGLDHVAYDVNGELIVRAASGGGDTSGGGDGSGAAREAALLAFVATVSPLPVPEPVFADGGLLAYRRLPGTPLNQCPAGTVAVADLAEALAALLSALHRVPAAGVAAAGGADLVPVDDAPLSDWSDEAVATYPAVSEAVPPRLRPRIERFLAAAPPGPPPARVFCHNDLGAEHVLADTATAAVTGVIDWSDAAIADPAHDLGRLFRDLGPGVFAAIMDQYAAASGAGTDATLRRRAVFYARCTVLEDIAYGLGDGPRHYADLGLRHLAHTFGPEDDAGV